MTDTSTDIKNTHGLVSIAMCTYNGAVHIKEQLDSLINQTYPHLEIVIVDDGSTDNTVQIIHEYAQKDYRIKLYQNEKNLGYNKNFEKAVQLTTGAYIAISDQDDIWALHKIAAMLESCPVTAPAENIFIYSISREFSGNTPQTGEENKPIRYYEGAVPEKLVFDSPIHGHACMFHRTLLAKALPFPEQVFYDWWLSMIASATGKVICVKETLTYHRIWNNNNSKVLLDIEEKTVRTDKLRKQSIAAMEAFLQRPFANKKTREVLESYSYLLRQKKKSTFSWPMFIFYFKNRAITFHYKRKRNFISLLKNSIKKSFTGL
jgi:glycosyltransferase involved in cell wall biosynthesis